MAQGAALERGTTAQESDKRRQILEGARTVFLSAGYDGASMGEIARAAAAIEVLGERYPEHLQRLVDR